MAPQEHRQRPPSARVSTASAVTISGPGARTVTGEVTPDISMGVLELGSLYLGDAGIATIHGLEERIDQILGPRGHAQLRRFLNALLSAG